MSAELLRVAVVSTSLARRDRIASMLRDIPGIQNTGAVATIGELGQLAPIPDAVVVEAPADIAVDALLESSPPLPIVILTDELDHNAGVRLLLAGSVAILERDPPARHLSAAVRAAAGGLSTLSPAHLPTLVDPAAKLATPPETEWIAPLTPRELQILRMLSDGQANKSIAAELQISEHTAKFHVGQILAKLGAESRTEAVMIGIRHGLIMV